MASPIRTLARGLAVTASVACACTSPEPGEASDDAATGCGAEDSSGELGVNTTELGAQLSCAIAADPECGFLLVFEDGSGEQAGAPGPDTSATGVRARRFGPEATASEPDQQLDTTMSDAQGTPDVALAADGSFVAVWTDLSTGSARIRARLLAADGLPAVNAITGDDADFGVSQDAVGDESSSPAVAAAPDGSFVVTWQRSRMGGSPQIFARRFEAGGIPAGGSDGAGGELAVSSTAASSPAIAAIDSGWAVVSVTVGLPSAVTVHLLDAQASVTGAAVAVSDVASYAGSPAVAALGQRLIVVWEGVDGDGHGIRGRLLDAAGAPTGAEIAVNGSEAGDQMEPVVATSTSGALVAWTDGDTTGGDGWSVRARRLDSSGAPLAPDFMVNVTAEGAQRQPCAAARGGGWVVAWTDGSGLWDASGTAIRARVLPQAGL